MKRTLCVVAALGALSLTASCTPLRDDVTYSADAATEDARASTTTPDAGTLDAGIDAGMDAGTSLDARSDVGAPDPDADPADVGSTAMCTLHFVESVGRVGYVRVADAADLRPVSLTVEAWVTFDQDSLAEPVQPILLRSIGYDFQDAFGIWYQGRALHAGIGATGPSDAIEYAPPVLDSLAQWNHVALTYDASLKVERFFVNGIEAGSRSAEPPTWDALSPYVLIGADVDQSYELSNLHGRIADVLMWNEPRSASEIKSDKAGCAHDDDPALILHVPLIGRSASALTDVARHHDVTMRQYGGGLVPQWQCDSREPPRNGACAP